MPGEAPPVGTPPVGTPPVGTPPGEGTPPVGTPPVGDKPTVVGAPEKYAFNLPEGVKLEGETLTAFEKFARDLNLPQDAAQKFVDREIAIQKDANEYAAAEVKKQGTAWETAGRQDAEIGGAKYEENLGVANKALDAYGSAALKEMLNTTPMGKHPEVVRFLVKIGKAIAEDKFVPAGNVTQGGADAGLRAMYPTHTATAA